MSDGSGGERGEKRADTDKDKDKDTGTEPVTRLYPQPGGLAFPAGGEYSTVVLSSISKGKGNNINNTNNNRIELGATRDTSRISHRERKEEPALFGAIARSLCSGKRVRRGTDMACYGLLQHQLPKDRITLCGLGGRQAEAQDKYKWVGILLLTSVLLTLFPHTRMHYTATVPTTAPPTHLDCRRVEQRSLSDRVKRALFYPPSQ